MELIDNMQHLREDEYDDVLKSGGFSEPGENRAAQETSVDESEIEYAPSTDDTYDPVRTYLAALGAEPLLKREQEVALAKQIEHGEKLAVTAGARSRVSNDARLRVGVDLPNGTRPIEHH